MKNQDEAVIYAEVLNDLVVEDPLGGETQADKELREASAKYAESARALKAIVTQDWERIPATPAGTKAPRKRVGRK